MPTNNTRWAMRDVINSTTLGHTYTRKELAQFMFIVPEQALKMPWASISRIVGRVMDRLTRDGSFEKNDLGWKRVAG